MLSAVVRARRQVKYWDQCWCQVRIFLATEDGDRAARRTERTRYVARRLQLFRFRP